MKEDRFMLLFPLMFSHPMNVEIRCGAPGLAGRKGPVLLGPCTRPVRPQLLSATVAGGSWEERPDQGLGLNTAEAPPARPSGGGDAGPAVHRPGRAPTFPRAVGNRGGFCRGES